MFKRILKIGSAIVLIAALGALVYADVRYEAIRAASAAEFSAYSERFPHAQILVNPDMAHEAIANVLASRLGREVPDWLLSRTMPYRLEATVEANHDESEIFITVFGSLRRLGTIALGQLNTYGLLDKLPEVAWKDGGLTEPARGVLFGEGALAMEPQAEEAVWAEWNLPVFLTPTEPDGGHFVEAVLDNRDGGAYLIFASLVSAFDWDLDDQKQDIGIATMKFVHSVRLYMDPQPGDALRVLLAFEILPEAKDRVAVHSVREAVEEGIVELQKRLERHEIQFKGTMEWRKNIMVFEYRLENFSKALDLLVQGQLL